jgi:hypothetical protein
LLDSQRIGRRTRREWVFPLEDDADRASADAEAAATASEPRTWLSSMATALVEQKQELMLVRRELDQLREAVRTLEQGEMMTEEVARTFTWREAHPEDFRKHAGRHVAWGDQGIVASGETYAEVLKELNKLGNPRGLGIEYVPKAPRVRR